jgi:V-type H+-transporting ATPase subunit C
LGFPAQEFNCDPQAYLKRLEMKSKLEMELNTLNMKLLKECRAFFGELFQALMHLKIMRVFIDGVLRFGIPPKFYMCVMRADRDKDKKIMDGLSHHFAEEHLREMYGEKADN